MAVDLKAFENFLKKFQKDGEYYPNAKDGLSKRDLALLNSFAKDFSKVASSDSSPGNIDFDKLIEEQDIIRNYLDAMKDNFADEKHYNEVRMPIIRSQKRVLINQLKLHAKHQHLTPKQIELIQKQIRVLSKVQQVRRKEEISEKKGAQVAEQMLQATLGISTVYNGPGGKKIIGIIKGMSRQLKKSLTATNMIATVLTRATEHFIMADKAAFHAFQNAGFSNYTKDLAETSQELINGAVVDPYGKIAQMDIQIKNGIRSFHRMKFGTLAQRQMTARSVEMQQLGAESSDIVSVMSTLIGVFHDDALDVVQAQDYMYGVAEETRRGVRTTARDMAATLPVYVKYGRAAGMEMFRRMSMVAAKTNLDVKDLMTLTERFDNSEDALEQAAKFNALLGGNFLNGLELLKAKPDEKVKLIAEAYNRAEASMGLTSANVQRQIAENFNQRIGDFKSMVRGNFDDFEKDMSEKLEIPSMQKRAKDLIESKSMAEAMRAKMTALAMKVTNQLLQNEYILKAIKLALQKPKEVIIGIVSVLGAMKAISLARSIVGTPAKPEYVVDVSGGMGGGGRRGRGGRGSGRGPRGGGFKGSVYATKPPAPTAPPKPSSLVSRASEALKSTGGYIKSLFSRGVDVAKSAGSAFVRGAKSVGRKVVSVGRTALNFATSGFKAIGSAITRGLSRLGPVAAYFKDKVGLVYQGLKNLNPRNMLKNLANVVVKSGIGKFVGIIVKAIGYVAAPVITAVFTDFAIKKMISAGLTGPRLDQMVGEVAINNLAGLVLGTVAAGLAQSINLAFPGAGIILGSAAYLLGDLLGSKLIGPLLTYLAPSLAPFVGKALLKTSRYQKMIKQQKEKSGVSQGNISTVTPESQKRSKQTYTVEKKVGSFQFDDTPGSVSTAPMKRREFENSKKDGLLLETIYNMKTRMEQISKIETKVTLNVEGRVLGVATLNG